MLLLAISSCKERFDVFQNKEKLADGLEMQPGNTVVVRHSTSGEMSGNDFEISSLFCHSIAKV